MSVPGNRWHPQPGELAQLGPFQTVLRLEGGSIQVSRQANRHIVVTDEGTITNLLPDENLPPITAREFASADDLWRYVKQRWPGAERP